MNVTTCTEKGYRFLYDMSVQHNTPITYIYYFVLWPTNKQLFHKLSHSTYMFRQCCDILRQLVINILTTYTSMSSAAVGNTIYNYFTYGFAIEISMFKILKILKLSYLKSNGLKIILLLWFSRSQSVWWLYIQSVCWCFFSCRPGITFFFPTN